MIIKATLLSSAFWLVVMFLFLIFQLWASK
jgi:hypothetical protein